MFDALSVKAKQDKNRKLKLLLIKIFFFILYYFPIKDDRICLRLRSNWKRLYKYRTNNKLIRYLHFKLIKILNCAIMTVQVLAVHGDGRPAINQEVKSVSVTLPSEVPDNRVLK